MDIFDRLKAAAADEVGAGGSVGLLVQEEQFIGSFYAKDTGNYDSFDLGVAKNNTLSVIWAGPGTKVWFKNTAATTRLDGRTTSAVTMFTPTGLVIGDYLKWDGSKYVEGLVTNSMLRVTAIDIPNAYVEAVLTA